MVIFVYFCLFLLKEIYSQTTVCSLVDLDSGEDSDETELGKMNFRCCFLLLFIYKKLAVQTDGLLSCFFTIEKNSKVNKIPWP